MSEAAADLGRPAARPEDRPAPPAVVRPGAVFHGLVSLSRSARIDGRVDGDVVAARGLWIGRDGRVAGRVEAEDVVVAGELEGEIFGRRRIELLPTARVVGNLHAPRVILAEGAYLEGSCASGPAPERETAAQTA